MHETTSSVSPLVAYRDHEIAIEARRNALVRDIARLERRVAPLRVLAEQLDALKQERDACDARLGRAPRPARRRRWLLALALAHVALGGAVVGLFVLPGNRPPRANLTRIAAQEIRSAVLLYLTSHGPRPHCPTTEDLVSAHMIVGEQRALDAWDRQFRIVCDGDDVRVISAGADGVFGAESDDIE